MTDILLQRFIHVLINNLQVVLLNALNQRPQISEIGLLLKVKLYQKNNQQKKYTSQLLEDLKNEKYTKQNICGANFVDMQLISKFDKGIHFSLCVIDIYRKYKCIVPSKNKKVLQLLMFFRKS